eukprot:GFUD01020431.1.p1 GENE.GFUD01020431.1~~GFUD01020431.1.p1  ORF type:complete len:371 (+),score=61.10 GFUD01020431.1:46-1158(+)
MDFHALRIFIGSCHMIGPVKMSLNKSALSIVFDQDNEPPLTPAVIQNIDLKKIEHSELSSTIPFLCLYLTRDCYSKIQKKLSIEQYSDYKSDVKQRIFIVYNLEYLSPRLLDQPSEILKLLSKHFLQRKIVKLGLEDATKLLRSAGYNMFSFLFTVETGWFTNYQLLPAWDQRRYGVRSNENRKVSSYGYFLGDDRMTRKEFLLMIKSLDTQEELDRFLTSIFWHPRMIFDQSLDFIADHQCSSPVCAKFSLVKCSVCKVALYCDQECQVRDVEHTKQRCAELKKWRKAKLENLYAKMSTAIFTEKYDIPDIVSYECFISKVRSKIFEHYSGDLISRIDFLKEELALRNVTITDSLPEYVQQLVNANKQK